jgi:predicted MFS family arabinose efflux permease
VAAGAALSLAFGALGRAARVPMFWLLFGTFFVCGLTTNGLVGTHLIAYCGDHGIAPVAAAGLLSTMGLFDLVGTTASGWLTDRFDPRRLLVAYYGLRGVSLIVLPFCNFGPASLGVFAVFYGLDWIATVPPTVALATRAFGAREAPVVFGWVNVGHQLGAGVAAFGAGLVRQEFGRYDPAFMIAGLFGVIAAAILMLAIANGRSTVAQLSV